MQANIEQISPTRFIARHRGQSAFDGGVMALQVDGEIFRVGLVGGDTLITGRIVDGIHAVWGDPPAEHVDTIDRLTQALVDSLAG